MTNTYNECPYCHATIKNGLLSSNAIADPFYTRVINAINNTAVPAHCEKCYPKPYEEAKAKVNEEVDLAKKELYDIIGYIPVISAQNPLNWDYEILAMVTGQSVTGTGVISEFTSSWTDLFGVQSNRYNAKLKAGEQLCFAQLRKQAADIGGNAVIATDIDYSEVGGDKGMLMVCMAGTAVRIRNLNVLSEARQQYLPTIERVNNRLIELQKLFSVKGGLV